MATSSPLLSGRCEQCPQTLLDSTIFGLRVTGFLAGDILAVVFFGVFFAGIV